MGANGSSDTEPFSSMAPYLRFQASRSIIYCCDTEPLWWFSPLLALQNLHFIACDLFLDAITIHFSIFKLPCVSALIGNVWHINKQNQPTNPDGEKSFFVVAHWTSTKQRWLHSPNYNKLMKTPLSTAPVICMDSLQYQ